MRRIFTLPLLITAIMLTPLANAQTQTESKACDALMQKVQKRLQGKGIQTYTLEWVQASAKNEGRVVGRCGKEKLKLIYNQHPTVRAKPVDSIPSEPNSVAPTPMPAATKESETAVQVVTAKPALAIPEPSPAVKQKIVEKPAPTTSEKAAEQPVIAVKELIQSLRTSNGAFATSMQALIDSTDATTPLISAYYAATYDATFRFNVILLLNQKIKSKKLISADIDAISQCLLDSLKDSSPLVRSEALWGLGLTRNKKFAPAVNVLLKDSDAAVRNEAAITAGLLR